MKFLNFVLISMMLILSNSANSALVDHGSFTTDTSTNLDWLDLTESTGYSYNQMLVNFSDVNSQFYGFSYATQNDLEFLFLNAGFLGSFSASYITDPNDRAALSLLFNLFGQTGTNCCARSDGLFDDGDSNPTISFLFLIPEYNTGLSELGFIYNQINPDVSDWPVFSSNTMGSWIYRDTNFVPLPAAAWLFGSGLIGLMCFSRRKKS